MEIAILIAGIGLWALSLVQQLFITTVSKRVDLLRREMHALERRISALDDPFQPPQREPKP